MKLFFEFFPILLFFIAFKWYGIYVATAVAIAAAVIQVIFSYVRHKKVEPMLWLSLGVIVVFGGATLLLHNELFIKWKPSILYWLFAVILGGGQLFFKKNLIQTMLQKQMQLPEKIWGRLNISWSAFFLGLGILNLFVAYHYSTKTWVNFKLFGVLVCMFVFVVAQTLLLSPYITEEEKKQ
jgi:intracellular septation protein